MKPVMATTTRLRTNAVIGTCSLGWIFPMWLENIMLLSRADDHVKRDAVCCAAFMMKNPMIIWKIIIVKVAATELVACRNISVAGSL